jgi:hypothetical protein
LSDAGSRLRAGLKNDKNLFAIMTYYKSQKSNHDSTLNFMAVGTSLRPVFYDLEDREITFLIKLSPEELKVKCRQYALYFKQNDFMK